jgi:hypothetical protein
VFIRLLSAFLNRLSVGHERSCAGLPWLSVGFLNTSQGHVRRCLFRDIRGSAQFAVSNLGPLDYEEFFGIGQGSPAKVSADLSLLVVTLVLVAGSGSPNAGPKMIVNRLKSAHSVVIECPDLTGSMKAAPSTA